jgi:dipeptidyl aminopeptidase/acylaminoacyl peptidase
MRVWVIWVAVLAFAAPAWAAPPIEVYGHLPSTENMIISPKGDRMAFIGVTGEERRVFVRQLGGPMLMAAPIGETKVRSLSWADDDHLLIFSTETAHANAMIGEQFEGESLFLANLKTHKLVAPLVDTSFMPLVEGQYGAREMGGHSYVFMGLISAGRGDEVQKPVDLYRMDLDSLDIVRVSKGGEHGVAWVLDANGQVIAEESYNGEAGEWRLYAGAQHDKPLLTVKSDADAVGVQGLGRSPGTVLVDGVHGEGLPPEEVDLKTGAVTDFLPDHTEIGRILRDRTTHLAIGYSFGRDHPKVKLFDPVLDAKLQKALHPFADERTIYLDGDDSLNRILLHTDGDKDSGTYYLVDLTARQATALGYDYPPVGSDDVGARRMFDYKAADGMDLQGVLTLPPGRTPKNLPVIVLPHGGPRGHDGLAFDWWSEAFAARGYAVFQPNFRGSDGYGAKLLKAGYGQWGRKMQTDITDGLKALAAQGIVDPKRACVMGWSYGGYAAMASITVQNGFYRCAVAGAGVSDLNTMLEWVLDRAGYRDNEASRYWNLAMGAKGPDDPALHEISPASLAAKADAPILLIFGKDDTVVPTAQSREMERALRSAGKPVEVLVLDKEDHWLSRENTRIQMLKAADAFIEKYNPPN